MVNYPAEETFFIVPDVYVNIPGRSGTDLLFFVRSNEMAKLIVIAR